MNIYVERHRERKRERERVYRHSAPWMVASVNPMTIGMIVPVSATPKARIPTFWICR